MNRREFSKSLAGAWAATAAAAPSQQTGVEVNDVHSQLNATRVHRIQPVPSAAALPKLIAAAARESRPVCVCGSRHAMGGQQFATDAVLLDTVAMKRVLGFDRKRGHIEVEAGIEWPELINYLLDTQRGNSQAWGIAQKQTGADRLTIGGALAANVHGRGLRMKPFIADVEAFTLVDAQGRSHRCSRAENTERFRLAIGGYGLIGVISTVTLRLQPRRKLKRVVEVIPISDLMRRFEQRIADGFLYGDFQYAIDPKSPDFLQRGVFSCYLPVDPSTPMPAEQKELSNEEWLQLLYLTHADKSKSFETYAKYYLSTSGQIYWSDTHQLSFYPAGYHQALDGKLGARDRGTEMITEIYVPRAELAGFMKETADDFRKNQVDVIYGTIRLIERDDESFLRWARQSYACIIFNLHVPHTPRGLEHSAEAFRRLIAMASRRGGSYYLTYHRHATRQQVEACYPQLVEFLRLKRKYDPDERFQSEWYRHYKKMFADAL